MSERSGESADASGLKTPWLRTELAEHLADLSSEDWLTQALTDAGQGQLDTVLNFFDDTGLIDEPVGRIGNILRDQSEADAMARLGAAVNEALDADGSPEAWHGVPDAAREALHALKTP